EGTDHFRLWSTKPWNSAPLYPRRRKELLSLEGIAERPKAVDLLLGERLGPTVLDHARDRRDELGRGLAPAHRHLLHVQHHAAQDGPGPRLEDGDRGRTTGAVDHHRTDRGLLRSRVAGGGVFVVVHHPLDRRGREQPDLQVFLGPQFGSIVAPGRGPGTPESWPGAAPRRVR